MRKKEEGPATRRTPTLAVFALQRASCVSTVSVRCFRAIPAHSASRSLRRAATLLCSTACIGQRAVCVFPFLFYLTRGGRPLAPSLQRAVPSRTSETQLPRLQLYQHHCGACAPIVLSPPLTAPAPAAACSILAALACYIYTVYPIYSLYSNSIHNTVCCCSVQTAQKLQKGFRLYLRLMSKTYARVHKRRCVHLK